MISGGRMYKTTSRKAISPVLATLLLIVITVVAGLIVYAWIMDYFGTRVGKELMITHIDFKPGEDPPDWGGGNEIITIYIKNTGTVTIVWSEVYVEFPDGTTVEEPNLSIEPGETESYSLVDTLNIGDVVLIKVIADGLIVQHRATVS